MRNRPDYLRLVCVTQLPALSRRFFLIELRAGYVTVAGYLACIGRPNSPFGFLLRFRPHLLTLLSHIYWYATNRRRGRPINSCRSLQGLFRGLGSAAVGHTHFGGLDVLHTGQTVIRTALLSITT